MRTRLVALIDVLGFAKKMNDLSRGELDPGTVLKSLRSLKRSGEGIEGVGWDGSFDAQVFSDSITISLDNTPSNFLNLLAFIASKTHTLAENDFWIRGALVQGEIYIKDGIAFGQGIVDAHNKEKYLAKVPRIVVDGELARSMLSIAEDENPGDDFVKKSSCAIPPMVFFSSLHSDTS
jgi:hypothetical protein